MFRLSPSVLNSRSLLYHRNSLNMQQSAVISSRNCNPQVKNVLERQNCKKQIPPPYQPRDLRPFIGVIALAVLTGSFTVYAKENPYVRDWLTINAPWFDDFIAVAYEEEMTYSEFVRQFAEGGKVSVGKMSSNVMENARILPMPVSNNVDELRMKDLEELHCCIREAGQKLLNNYKEAKAACVKYNEFVESNMPYFNKMTSNKLEAAKSERIDIVQTAMENAHCNTKRFDQLAFCFENGTPATPQEKKCIIDLIEQFRCNINNNKVSYLEEDNTSETLDRLWATVLETTTQYTDEAEILLPGLDYSSEKPQLHGDPDLFLFHSTRYVKKLQEELNATEASMTRRTNLSLATLPQDDESVKARNNDINEYYNDDKICLELEFEDRYKVLKEKNDAALKDTLAKQLKKQEELIDCDLCLRENEMKKKIDKMIDEKVAEEKRMLAPKLALVRKQVQYIEHKIAEKCEAENATRRSRELYAAGAALVAATKRGCPIVKIDKELQAIQKVAHNDRLVHAVLKSIPENVWKDGVVPESVLRNRYHSMEKLALKVALVEQEGASLPIYVASWIQSLFLFMKLSGIPKHEVENKPTEPITDLDTFDLLQRARYWVDQGDYHRAVQYVSALQGASLAAAWSWYNAAHDYLQLRQAADALQAHAAALALQYV